MAQEESGAQLYPQQDREKMEDEDDDEEEDTEAKVKAPSFYSDAQKYWKARSFIVYSLSPLSFCVFGIPGYSCYSRWRNGWICKLVIT